MPSEAASTQLPDSTASSSRNLTIGDLARRTGLKPATLRMWETRHGFPRAERRDSGHRRYGESDVELVRQVVLRRDSGARLEMAIAEAALIQAAVEEPPGAISVYAVLRSRYPSLQPQRLKKSTLIAVSWAIEDECCARAEKPIIFGAFQRQRYFRASEERWTELARIARSTTAFADFPDATESQGGTRLVTLPEDSPMRKEWVVVCDAPYYPAMLTAWELPGQSTVPDRQRLFEAIWTVEPAAVRNAARTCAQIALHLGDAEAAPLLYELAETPPNPPVELLNATGLLNRVVAYVDGMA